MWCLFVLAQPSDAQTPTTPGEEAPLLLQSCRVSENLIKEMHKLNESQLYRELMRSGLGLEMPNEARRPRSRTASGSHFEFLGYATSEPWFRPLCEPTMWMGAEDGSLLVHSAVRTWSTPLFSIRFPDSVLAICSLLGRVFVALGDGTLLVFSRAYDVLPGQQEVGSLAWSEWDLHNYTTIDFGCPRHPIRALCPVGAKHVWAGYQNRIIVIDVDTLEFVVRLYKTLKFNFD